MSIEPVPAEAANTGRGLHRFGALRALLRLRLCRCCRLGTACRWQRLRWATVSSPSGRGCTTTGHRDPDHCCDDGVEHRVPGWFPMSSISSTIRLEDQQEGDSGAAPAPVGDLDLLPLHLCFRSRTAGLRGGRPKLRRARSAAVIGWVRGALETGTRGRSPRTEWRRTRTERSPSTGSPSSWRTPRPSDRARRRQSQVRRTRRPRRPYGDYTGVVGRCSRDFLVLARGHRPSSSRETTFAPASDRPRFRHLRDSVDGINTSATEKGAQLHAH